MEFDCSREEFEIFENIVEENNLISSFSRDVLLVLLGVKPGCSANSPHEIEFFRDKLDRMGLYLKQVELDFVEVSEDEKHLEEKLSTGYFIARDRDHLNSLKDRYGEDEKIRYHRDFGLFCGYPEADVEWFLKDGELWDTAEEFEDLDFIRPELVNYVPKPKKECVKRAEKISEKYRKALKEADEKFDSSVGEKLLAV